MPEDPFHHPHDALFRAAFGEPARAAALLRRALPATLAAAIDWAALRRLDASFVDRDLRQQQADLLFAARLADRDVLIYLLLEHKAEPDRWTAFQLLRYVVRVWQRFRRELPATEHLPPVLPFVLHHGTRAWHAPTTLRELLDLDGAPPALRDLQPEARFVLDDLAAGAALPRHHHDAAVVLPLLHLQQLRRVADTAALLRRWRALHLQVMALPGGQELLDQLISYVAAVSDADPTDLRDAYRSIHATTEQTYMTVAKKLIAEGLVRGRQEGRQQGRQEGRQEGRRQGLQQGRAELLLTLLRQRFGPLPTDLAERIAVAELADLDRWAGRLLTAGSLPEVFAS